MPQARQGNAVAELDIGLMHFSGHGLPKDYSEAARWFAASALQGQIGAQINLGVLYATGDGLPQDHIRAYVWFNVAASRNNSSAAKYRDHIASEITPDQLRAAQALADKCKASNYSDCGGTASTR
ncbi:MAG TPA: tetratricopeptide repeat protein [Rhizomicrobium sp.]|nr:tetratricopeptide repeat protein [Rhizomicrobium sp.]